MPGEKPHRRLSLTQPTAVPDSAVQQERDSPALPVIEQRLQAELAAIQERMNAWDLRLLRLTEVVERVTTVLPGAATQPSRSARQQSENVLARSNDPAADSAVGPLSERVQICVGSHLREVELPDARVAAISTLSIAHQHESIEEAGLQIPVVSTTIPSLERVRIQVRDTSGKVTPRPVGLIQPSNLAC